jgi:nicotinamide-nucleotide amidase
MPTLAAMAEAVAALLKARGETVAVSESSTGGLISAALLAVPGASAYFIGGGVIYTHKAREVLLEQRLADHPGMRASTEAYALLCASAIRARLGTTWGLGETGATGPSGNRYGDAPGHSCIAVMGPPAQPHARDRAVGARGQHVALCARSPRPARGGDPQRLARISHRK